MDTNKKKIDPIDEALRLLALSEGDSNEAIIDASKQLQYITSVTYKSEPSDEYSRNMIERLYARLAVDSLGNILTTALDKSQHQTDDFVSKVNLPKESLEQLKADLVFANSIPVVSLRDLLKELKIPFETAKQGILKTFHMLKSDISFQAVLSSNARLAYRRRNSKMSSNTKSGKADSQYLFENEEALSKYVDRLQELY